METNEWWKFYKTIAENGNLILFPIFVIGTFVTLFAGYPANKDWWAKRSKKSFLKRLAKKEENFIQIEDLRGGNSTDLIIHIFEETVYAFIPIIVSLMIFIFTVLLYISTAGSNPSQIIQYEIYLFMFITYLASMWTMREVGKLADFASRLYNPYRSAKKLIISINDGKSRGFIESSDNVLAEKVSSSKIFTESGKNDLRVLAGMKSDAELKLDETILKMKKVLGEDKQ